VNASMRLGDLFLSCRDLQEFELNPVMVNPRGMGLRVVDALVVASPK